MRAVLNPHPTSQQTHRDPASSGTHLRPRCAHPTHPSALAGVKMPCPRKAEKNPKKNKTKKIITFSTQFQWDLTARMQVEQGLGSANLLGLGKGCSHGMRRMKEQLLWMLEPSSLSSLPGAWARGGELYTWRNIIPSLARKYFTSRLKIEAKMSSAIRGNRLGFKFCLSIFLYNVAVSIRK